MMIVRDNKPTLAPRRPYGRPALYALALGAALLVASCSPAIERRGNLPDPAVLADIRPGVHTKEQVSQLLGTPSSVAPFDKNIWYYMGQKTEKIAFFKPEILDQQVVAIKFNDKGVVSEVRRFNQADGKEVDVVERETPTRGQELTFVRALLGSLGFLGRNPLNSEATYKREGRN